MRLALALVLVAMGCGPEFAVVPQGGAPRVTAQAQTGATLTALANQWEADPFDLADYVTPIAVELYNPGPHDVRVAYSDFVLTDERGTRYPAINPYIPAAMGQITPYQKKPVMLAQVTVGPPGGSRGGGFSGGGRIGGFSGGVRPPPAPRYWGTPGGFGRTYIGPPRGRSSVLRPGIGFGVGSSWNRFYVYGGLRGFYGPGALYWGGPFAYPPWYSTWVFWWGPSYYPSAQPSPDVLALGLPEGVLPPGGRVDGFVYFKRATSKATRQLQLRWDVYDARSGQQVGSTQVALEVLPL